VVPEAGTASLLTPSAKGEVAPSVLLGGHAARGHTLSAVPHHWHEAGRALVASVASPLCSMTWILQERVVG
jgi:hypothetical protein